MEPMQLLFKFIVVIDFVAITIIVIAFILVSLLALNIITLPRIVPTSTSLPLNPPLLTMVNFTPTPSPTAAPKTSGMPYGASRTETITVIIHWNYDHLSINYR